ncbi:MAG: TlpA family protein disulfide reductase [Saprospiraceae bacterium]|nr:TlpA family protein disulfide reductase [Saprospiraceae bacterium]
MKKLSITLLLSVFFIGLCVAQENDKKFQTIPSANLKTISGETVNSETFSNDGKPYIISFWATYCKPCIKELNAIAEVYDDWQEEQGVKIIAISIDDSRTSRSVPVLISGKGWEYEFYLDENSDFKRAMNVNNVPHTFIVNGNNEIVWQHTTYSEGAEDELIELIEKLNNGEDISGE